MVSDHRNCTDKIVSSKVISRAVTYSLLMYFFSPVAENVVNVNNCILFWSSKAVTSLGQPRFSCE